MNKKYIVRLTDEERAVCEATIKKEKGKSEKLRQAFVLQGFEAALVRKKPATSPTPKRLDGVGEAKLIALRLGKPPAGFGRWTLRLLADQLAELEIVESISPETVRQTLKKTV